MIDDAGLTLLRSIESLMKDLTHEMRRQNDATEELARRRRMGAAREAKRRSALRQNDATIAKPAESQDRPLRQNGVRSQVVIALSSSSQDLDQEQRKNLQPDATMASREPAEPITRPVWAAYSTAYRLRYGVAPLRNKRVNGQMAQFVARVPAESASHIAAFYVRHNEQFYVRDRHGVGLLLKDAEKLHTDWKSGRPMTSTEARQTDKTQANVSGWAGMLKEKPNAVG